MNGSEPDPGPWQQRYLEEIRKIDADQAPHGFYGMRDLLRERNGGLLPMWKLLGSNFPATNPAIRLSWSDASAHGGVVSFSVPSLGNVSLTVETHASTKVRHYGDGYVMDKVHGKKAAENAARLESLVPGFWRMPKDKKAFAIAMKLAPSLKIHALLFIAHVPTSRRFDKLLGKTRDPAFLDHYQLSFHSLEWEDIYRRGFSTGLFLWTTGLRPDFSD